MFSLNHSRLNIVDGSKGHFLHFLATLCQFKVVAVNIIYVQQYFHRFVNKSIMRLSEKNLLVRDQPQIDENIVIVGITVI